MLAALRSAEHRLHVDLVVEARRRAVPQGQLDHRQVQPALRPRRVRDPAAPQPLHARHLEVRHVAPVVDDAHEVRLVEAHAQPHDAPRGHRVDRLEHGGGVPRPALRCPCVEKKRRLPVLKTPSQEEEEAAARPPWQWVGFGALAIFAVWLPLAYLAGARRVAAGRRRRGSIAAVGGAGGVSGDRVAGRRVPRRPMGRGAVSACARRRWPGSRRRSSRAGIALGAPGALAGALLSVVVAVPFRGARRSTRPPAPLAPGVRVPAAC